MLHHWLLTHTHTQREAKKQYCRIYNQINVMYGKVFRRLMKTYKESYEVRNIYEVSGGRTNPQAVFDMISVWHERIVSVSICSECLHACMLCLFSLMSACGCGLLLKHCCLAWNIPQIICVMKPNPLCSFWQWRSQQIEQLCDTT